MRKRTAILVLTIAVVLAASACGSGTPEATATPEPTNTPKATHTPEPTDTPLPTDTPTPTNTPMPTDTPEPTLTPTPDVGSRSEPVPFGEEIGLVMGEEKEFYLSITEAHHGQEAWARVKAANMFNDPPPENMQYILIFAGIRYIAGPDDEPLQLSEFDFRSVSSGQVLDIPSVVSPDPALDISFFPGAEGGGWVTLRALQDDSNPLAVVGMSYDGTGGFYLATK